MGRPTTLIVITDAEKRELERLASEQTSKRVPANIILLRARGIRQRDVATKLQISPTTVSLWSNRFRVNRLRGLEIKPRESFISRDKVEAILSGPRNSVRAIAKAHGISPTSVQRLLRGGKAKEVSEANLSNTNQETYEATLLSLEEPAARVSGKSRGERRLGNRRLRATINSTIKFIQRIQLERRRIQGYGNERIFLYVNPAVITGYRRGESFDFGLNRRRGLGHPKEARNADSFLLEGNTPRAKGFQRLLSTIKSSMRLDDPITIWINKSAKPSNILLVDGAMRLSAIGILQREFPDTFRSIPVQVLEGSRDASLTEIVRRNHPYRGNGTSLSELHRFLLRLLRADFPERLLDEALGLEYGTSAKHVEILSGENGRASFDAFRELICCDSLSNDTSMSIGGEKSLNDKRDFEIIEIDDLIAES